MEETLSMEQKNSLIEKRIEELWNLFEGCNVNDKVLLDQTISNFAFIELQLADLKYDILREGVIDEYKNGANQYGSKISAKIQTYNKLVSTYNTLYKILKDACPVIKQTSALADFQKAVMDAKAQAAKEIQKQLNSDE